MSYAKPDAIPKSQDDPCIVLHTVDTVRALERELNLVGLAIEAVDYYKNEYCGDRQPPCVCTHWFKIKLVNLHRRIFEPNVWFYVCMRKRVYEIRWTDDSGFSFVEDDFWINTPLFDRTQVAGKYIHSYGLRQAAADIKIAHQAAEVKTYKREAYDKYQSQVFKRKAVNSEAV